MARVSSGPQAPDRVVYREEGVALVVESDLCTQCQPKDASAIAAGSAPPRGLRRLTHSTGMECSGMLG